MTEFEIVNFSNKTRAALYKCRKYKSGNVKLKG